MVHKLHHLQIWLEICLSCLICYSIQFMHQFWIFYNRNKIESQNQPYFMLLSIWFHVFPLFSLFVLHFSLIFLALFCSFIFQQEKSMIIKTKSDQHLHFIIIRTVWIRWIVIHSPTSLVYNLSPFSNWGSQTWLSLFKCHWTSQILLDMR